jgi:hypothetical protein
MPLGPAGLITAIPHVRVLVLNCSFLLLVSRKSGINARNEPKKKTASGFQRPTIGSIPKPDKPFVPVLFFFLINFFILVLTSPSGF